MIKKVGLLMIIKIQYMKYSLLLILIFASCTQNQDPEQFAKEYCNCIESNKRDSTDYLRAKHICDSQFIIKYRYFKIFKVDMAIKDYGEIPESTMDSTQRFMNGFMDYMNKNCKYGGW